MSKDHKPDSAPKPMPAPQLPNIPISHDDPFQSDPDLLPPVAPASAPDPAPSGRGPGGAVARYGWGRSLDQGLAWVSVSEV